MAKPRVFVSSTYYDFKHLRSSLENFIEALGFEAILSEKGDIAYSPEIPLDESCYREVKSADIFVLIIGGRYGSQRSSDEKPLSKDFLDRYDSVTKLEYRSAIEQDVPIYIFIERAVYAEYQTFQRNRDNAAVKYAHVDSVNVFLLIEEILAQPRNNPVREFERYEDIEAWLLEQWAGLFKELLRRTSSQRQLTNLQSQVATLAEVGNTLKRYLEEVVQKVAPQQAVKIIHEEQKRLGTAVKANALRSNRFVDWLTTRTRMSFDDVVSALRKAKSFQDFVELASSYLVDEVGSQTRETILTNLRAQVDANEARELLDLTRLPITAQAFSKAPRAHPASRRVKETHDPDRP